uniref:Uncharacterized protein n=1 Tax=Oryza brachyantha TaxID=4533 RepID=J3LCT4_ORYBR
MISIYLGAQRTPGGYNITTHHDFSLESTYSISFDLEGCAEFLQGFLLLTLFH